MENLTPDFFNGLIVVNIVVGLGVAGWRLYRNLTSEPTNPLLDEAELVAYLKERQAYDAQRPPHTTEQE
jgi:hypothetical protein